MANVKDKLERTLINYYGKEKVVKISAYTTIGLGAFMGNKNVNTIIMDDNVEKIDTSAFDGCSNLQNIRLSKNLKYFSCGIFDDTLLYYKGNFKVFNIDKNNKLVEPFSVLTIMGNRKVYSENNRWNWVKDNYDIFYKENLYEAIGECSGEYGKDFIICEIEPRHIIRGIYGSTMICKSIKIIRRLDRLELIKMLSNYERKE